ncbi:DUF945 domain-containing protein [Escherichia coli]|nr:DUF945 domain-containing protein [Escherichia coli]
MSAFSFNTTYQMIPGIFRFVCTNGLVNRPGNPGD